MQGSVLGESPVIAPPEKRLVEEIDYALQYWPAKFVEKIETFYKRRYEKDDYVWYVKDPEAPQLAKIVNVVDGDSLEFFDLPKGSSSIPLSHFFAWQYML